VGGGQGGADTGDVEGDQCEETAEAEDEEAQVQEVDAADKESAEEIGSVVGVDMACGDDGEGVGTDGGDVVHAVEVRVAFAAAVGGSTLALALRL
jgi:hypothetical protein